MSCERKLCMFCVYRLKIYPNKECQSCGNDYNNYESEVESGNDNVL